jgi:DNA-binding NarL/FixJ family response regulator
MTLYREIEGSLPRRISSADQDQASEQPPGADGVLPEVTVVLADDQVATRAGVRRALAPHGFRIVAEVENAADAVIAALEHRPDVCMLEVRLPGNGIEAARRISDELPEAKIVMLTASERHDDLVAALRAGADGYLLKTTSADRLPYAIRGVLRGEAALPREMATGLIREFQDHGRKQRVLLSVSGHRVELTAREFEVLERLRRRETTSQVAGHLGIADVTVRRHVSAILHKLGTPDRSSALALLDREERRKVDELLPAS